VTSPAAGSSAGDLEACRAALRPLLELRLADFHGLPAAAGGTFDALFGPPKEVGEVRLGWFPAQRSTYEVPGPARGLLVYSREGQVLAADTLEVPPVEAMDALGAPTATMPHALRAEGAYVHEVLFGPRGLVLSVAEPRDRARPRWIVRCRAIRPIVSAREYGPALYRSLDDDIAF
jgi:hypothetical protein